MKSSAKCGCGMRLKRSSIRVSPMTLGCMRLKIGAGQNVGIPSPRAWLGFAHYALISPAPFRRTFRAWVQFFLPGFHPWNKDDRHLIQLAESEYEAAIMDSPEEQEEIAPLGEHPKRKRLPKVA